jgi:hypothetical protein
MIPAVAWMPKEKGKKLTTTARCELRLEGPDRHIPNKPQIRIPNRPLPIFWDLMSGVLFGLGFGNLGFQSQ